MIYPGLAIASAARAGQAPDARLRRHDHRRTQGRPGRRARFLERCQLFALAESLGGVESLIEHPAHHDPRLDPGRDVRAARHRDGLVRLSVGVEDVDDLIQDLRSALA